MFWSPYVTNYQELDWKGRKKVHTSISDRSIKHFTTPTTKWKRIHTLFFVFHLCTPPPYLSHNCRASIIQYGFKVFCQKVLVSLKNNNIAITCGLIQELYMVLNTFYGNRYCNLCKRPINILISHLKSF